MKEETKEKIFLGVLITLVVAAIGGGIAFIVKESLLHKEMPEG